jgi:hypothetical protein
MLQISGLHSAQIPAMKWGGVEGGKEHTVTPSCHFRIQNATAYSTQYTHHGFYFRVDALVIQPTHSRYWFYILRC